LVTWTYEKRASGISVCRGTLTLKNVDVHIPWGEVLYESIFYYVDLPEGLFIDIPKFCINGMGLDGGIMLDIWGNIKNNQTPYIQIVRPHVLKITEVYLDIEVKGRWK
jgi:hypothetical protein